MNEYPATPRINNPLVNVELFDVAGIPTVQLPRHRMCLEYLKHQIGAILQTEDLTLPVPVTQEDVS